MLLQHESTVIAQGRVRNKNLIIFLKKKEQKTPTKENKCIVRPLTTSTEKGKRNLPSNVN